MRHCEWGISKYTQAVSYNIFMIKSVRQCPVNREVNSMQCTMTQGNKTISHSKGKSSVTQSLSELLYWNMVWCYRMSINRLVWLAFVGTLNLLTHFTVSFLLMYILSLYITFISLSCEAIIILLLSSRKFERANIKLWLWKRISKNSGQDSSQLRQFDRYTDIRQWYR